MSENTDIGDSQPARASSRRVIAFSVAIGFLLGLAVAHQEQLWLAIVRYKLRDNIIDPDASSPGAHIESPSERITALCDRGHSRDAVEVLTGLLDHPQPFTREFACFLLPDCGNDALSALPVLAAKLRDPTTSNDDRSYILFASNRIHKQVLAQFPPELLAAPSVRRSDGRDQTPEGSVLPEQSLLEDQTARP